METGQVKTGSDASDTFYKMLQQTVRVTPAIAAGIQAEYPTVRALARGFREGGSTLLEDVTVRSIPFNFCA